jgi:hypothetical protein
METLRAVDQKSALMILPGRARGLRPSSPLRTVRDSFPSYGSSASQGLLIVIPANKFAS